MQYIGGQAKESGCIFCNRLESANDISSLILYRGSSVFVIMNLYPYNTGHIMLVPNQHAADPAELSSSTLREMGETLPLLTTSLKHVLGCDGFNVGLNIGSIAGAGVAAHLHEHIVPRWEGDANFMPILASTMVLPEMIPVTYAKIRSEIEREVRSASTAEVILFNENGDALLYKNQIPSVDLVPEKPVWKSVLEGVPGGVGRFEIAVWAGNESAQPVDHTSVALTLRGVVDGSLTADWDIVPANEVRVDSKTRSRVERAKQQLAPGT